MSAPSTSNSPPKAHLLHLPVELLSMVTSSLESSQDVVNLARGCKSLWHTLDHLEVYKKDAEYQLSHASHFAYLRNMTWDNLPSAKLYDGSRGMHEVLLGTYSKPREPILHWAIRTVDSIDAIEEIVQIFQAISPDLLHGAWHPSWPSPLTAAVAANRLDVVRLLLRHGCDIRGSQRPIYPWVPHYPDCSAEDALLVACSLGHGHEPMVNLLLDEGAVPRVQHMAFAGANGMVQTLHRLAPAVDVPATRHGWQHGGWHYPAFRMAVCCNDADGSGRAAASASAPASASNAEVLDFYMALVPELRLPRHLEYAVCDGLQQGYVENATHLFGLLVENEAYSPLQMCLLISQCPRSDAGLAITKLMHERYGAEVFTSSWSVTKHMLLVAIQNHPRDGGNAETIEFLLGTDSKFGDIHLDVVARSPHPRIFPAALIDRVYLALDNAPRPSVLVDYNLLNEEDLHLIRADAPGNEDEAVKEDD